MTDDDHDYEAEHAAETYAESAWLRHAERPDPDDEIEREREARDPGLIYLRSLGEDGPAQDDGEPIRLAGLGEA